MKRLLLVGFMVTAAAFAPRPAQAATLTFEGLGKNAIVTVDGFVSGTFYAGELTWSQSAWSDLPDLIYTYCVDLGHDVTTPEEVTRESTDGLTPPGPGNELIDYAVDAGKKAAWLFNTFAETVRTSGSGIDAAALQVAIWESLYDSSPDLAGGNFQLITDSSAFTGALIAQQIAGVAQGYLNQLYLPGGGYLTSEAIWLNAPIPEGQDQITNVPEPATIALLLLATLSLAAYQSLTSRRVALVAPRAAQFS